MFEYDKLNGIKSNSGNPYIPKLAETKQTLIIGLGDKPKYNTQLNIDCRKIHVEMHEVYLHMFCSLDQVLQQYTIQQ